MKRIIFLLAVASSIKSGNIRYCDIKGSVNNPGVYEVKNNYTIKNVIDDAGGLKDDSYTDNINLSKKVTDEMVIYIFNKSEMETVKKLNNCNCQKIYKYLECSKKNILKEDDLLTNVRTSKSLLEITSETSQKKEIQTSIVTTKNNITTEMPNKLYMININSCSLEELLNIKGLGEKKAKKIIEYREENGLFNNIEEIMNVNGIGESTFNSIKEYISV